MVKELKVHSEKLISNANVEMKKSIMKLAIENEKIKKTLDDQKKSQDQQAKGMSEQHKKLDFQG